MRIRPWRVRQSAVGGQMGSLLMRMGAIVGCLVGSAHAVDVPVAPKKLIVVDKVTATSTAKLVYVSKDRTAGITKGTGTDVDEITARFDVRYGNGSGSGAFVLPIGASDGTAVWLVNEDAVAKYVNEAAPGGVTQARVAVVKPGKLLKLVGRGRGDEPLDILTAGDPGAAGVRTAFCLANGDEEHCHCSIFPGCAYKPIAGGTGAKLVCRKGAGDPLCLATGCSPPSAVTRLEFRTGIGTMDCGGYHLSPAPTPPFGGEIHDAGGDKLSDLGLGCLYLGAGQSTVPGGAVPDEASSIFSIEKICDGEELRLIGDGGTGANDCTLGVDPDVRRCANGHRGTDGDGACTTDADCRPV